MRTLLDAWRLLRLDRLARSRLRARRPECRLCGCAVEDDDKMLLHGAVWHRDCLL